MNNLGGSENSIGKIISKLLFDGDSTLHFVFDDETKIKIFDDRQSCCETRYMTTDDDLDYFVGTELTGIEIKEAPNEPDERGEHEVQFLEVLTNKGSFKMANHNEHNGYYGGFEIKIEKE